MTFITGTLTNANPGPALYALIETPALALGWTLDDTVVIGSNTHKVLKSAAAGNAYSLDFYLDINYPTTGITGGMRIGPFEGYTAASDVGLRGPYGHVANSTLDATTYSRFGASTSALETNWHNSASATGVSIALSTSAFNYWVSITRNRIVVMLSVTPGEVLYSGFFTPTATHIAHTGAALFPLIVAKVSASGSANSQTSGAASAAVTRVPKASAITWSASVRIGGNDSLSFASGQAGVAASEFTGVTESLPLPVAFGIGNTAASTSTPSVAHVGDLDGLDICYMLTSAVRGDTVTIGSDTWYACTPNSSAGLIMKGV